MCVCLSADVFMDWKQNADEVIVRLRCGGGVLKREDIDTAFSDTACKVCFAGEHRLCAVGIPPFLDELKYIQ